MDDETIISSGRDQVLSSSSIFTSLEDSSSSSILTFNLIFSLNFLDGITLYLQLCTFRTWISFERVLNGPLVEELTRAIAEILFASKDI